LGDPDGDFAIRFKIEFTFLARELNTLHSVFTFFFENDFSKVLETLDKSPMFKLPLTTKGEASDKRTVV
jgi:hypothetical protein